MVAKRFYNGRSALSLHAFGNIRRRQDARAFGFLIVFQDYIAFSGQFFYGTERMVSGHPQLRAFQFVAVGPCQVY